MRKLFAAMSERFPGGRLCFDAANKRAVKLMLKTWVKTAGVTSIEDYFSVESVEKDIAPWMKNAKITERGYMLGYNDLRDPSVPRLFRLLGKLGDGFMKMRIVRMDFNRGICDDIEIAFRNNRKNKNTRRNTMQKESCLSVSESQCV